MRKRFRKYFLDLFRTSKNKYYISCVILSASDCFEKYKKNRAWLSFFGYIVKHANAVLNN